MIWLVLISLIVISESSGPRCCGWNCAIPYCPPQFTTLSLEREKYTLRLNGDDSFEIIEGYLPGNDSMTRSKIKNHVKLFEKETQSRAELVWERLLISFPKIFRRMHTFLIESCGVFGCTPNEIKHMQNSYLKVKSAIDNNDICEVMCELEIYESRFWFSGMELRKMMSYFSKVLDVIWNREQDLVDYLYFRKK